MSGKSDDFSKTNVILLQREITFGVAKCVSYVISGVCGETTTRNFIIEEGGGRVYYSL